MGKQIWEELFLNSKVKSLAVLEPKHKVKQWANINFGCYSN